MSGEDAPSQEARVPSSPTTIGAQPTSNDAITSSSHVAPSKLTSPAPMESLTPPPSTQQPASNGRAIVRTPTPQTSHLTSPPPTKLNDVAHSEPDETPIEVPSAGWIATANMDDLRLRMTELAAALRQARAEAASSKMQYKMLSMESNEQQQRMHVELSMVQREVDVLQLAEARRQSATADPYADNNAANATLLHEMSRHCDVLQRENEQYMDLNAQLHRTLEYQEGQLARVNEENERLRMRIKKNREHTNSYLDYLHEHSPQSLTATPVQPTPRSRAAVRNFDVRPTGLAPFEALLEADKVLSQETITAPSTPARGTAGRKNLGHRTAHSMSSLPSTPLRSRAPPHRTDLQTPPQYIPAMPMTEPARQLPPVSAPYSHSRHIRAGSSDSTITASSVERDHDGEGASDDEVPESQASQAATSMLRRTPVAQSMKGSQGGSFGGVGGSFKQTKLFGQITKPGLEVRMEKRRLSDVADEPGMKRARLGDAVGLGIH